MTSLHPARRSAERFDALVEAGRLDGADERTVELLELVGALRAVPRPEPRPEFSASLREQLMVAARTELVPAERTPRDDVAARLTVKPGRTRRERRVGIALGAIAVVGATSSMAVASQGSVAGDALYPIKRAIESTQAGFSVSDQAKGRTMLGTAAGRLDEVSELSRRDEPEAALVTSTLQAFSDQATQASDLLMSDYEQTGHEGSIEQLHAFTESSMATLAELDASIPRASQPALLAAAGVLFTIDSAAEQVCPACSGEGITEIPGQLLAGAQTTPDDEGTDTLAGGALAGTEPTEAPAQVDPPDQVSGLEPPAVPIQIPTQAPIPPLTETPVTGLGAEGGQSGQGQQGGQGQQQGNGPGKPKPTKPVDLNTTGVDGLTETVEGTVGGVNDVVGGVVQGVTGLLDGLTGGPSGPTP